MPTPRRERVRLCFGGTEVALLCVADLQPFVDAEELLATAAGGEPPYWMHLWPGARALARVVAADQAIAGARVLELGCGLALPSLVAARRGARIVATDRELEPLRFAADSAALNDCRLALVQMDWRAPCAGGFDLVLGADIGYDADAEEPLVAALVSLCRPGGRVVLADSVNTYRSSCAARMAAAGFSLHEETTAEEEEGRTVWVRILKGERR